MTPTIKVQSTAIDRRLFRIEIDQQAFGPVFDDRRKAETVAAWLAETWQELP